MVVSLTLLLFQGFAEGRIHLLLRQLRLEDLACAEG